MAIRRSEVGSATDGRIFKALTGVESIVRGIKCRECIWIIPSVEACDSFRGFPARGGL